MATGAGPAAPRRYHRSRALGAEPARGATEPPRPGKRGPRRSPDETRQEILDAAAYFLNQHPFRELTIPRLMSHTQVGRSAFYFHFRDIYEVVETLATDFRVQVLEYVERWSGAEVAPVEALKTFIIDTVNICAVNGPMLSAIIDAASEDARVERIHADITKIYQQTVTGVLVGEYQADRIAAMDFGEMAAVLVLATQAYLKARLGHTGRRDPVMVIATLQALWIRTIYGTVPE